MGASNWYPILQGGRDLLLTGVVFHPGAGLPWLKLPGCFRHLHLHYIHLYVPEVLLFQQSSLKLLIFFQMNASAQDDVDGLSQNVEFKPNQNSGSCVFTIEDDAIPEANETFSIDLTVGGGSGTVVSPSVAYLTILANDDAFGIIGFNEVGNNG